MKYLYILLALLLAGACKKSKKETPAGYAAAKVSINGKLAGENVYDSRGRRTETKNYNYFDANTPLQSTSTWRYNDAGQLLEFKVDYVNAGTADVRREYTYDAQGRVAGVKHYSGDTHTYAETRTYQGTTVYVEGKRNNAVAYTYEIIFDAKGNLTKEVYDDKMANDDRVTAYLEYDDKVSYAYTPGSPGNTKNNPVKILYTFSNPAISENYTETNVYEYNSEGYVTKRTTSNNRLVPEAPWVYTYELVKVK